MTLTLDWSRGPHIKKKGSVRLAMLEHALALVPCAAAAAYLHGATLLLLILATTIATVATHQLLNRALKRQRLLPDGRATLAGLVLALLLPVNTMWWAGAVVGALGMLVVWLIEHSKIRVRIHPVVPGVLAAKALGALLPDLLFAGGQARTLSVEAMPILLAAGGLYLVMRRHVNWRTPLVILGVGAVLALALGYDALAMVTSGTWMLGAFFLAADWRTCPVTPRGKVVSALIIGVVAALLDSYVLFSGGIVLSILVSNILTAPINRHTRLRAFGFGPRTTK